MKNLRQIAGILFLLCCTLAFAQAPQLMSYQAIVRNASGVLVANSNVGVRISILQNSTSGTAVYSETHALATNENGLVTLQIGGGNVQSGNFSTIDWGSGTYFIKTETDPNGGTNYSISGTSQLLSVPYALYAANTKSQGKATIYLTGGITDQQAAVQIADEAGPNTENIYIVGTTALTTVNVTGVNTLLNLQIVDNAVLQSVSINSVKTIYINMEIRSQNSNFTCSLPACTNVTATMAINVSGTLSMPALTKINTKSLGIAANTLNLPALANIKSDGALSISSTALSLPALAGVICNNYDRIASFNGVTSVDLPAIQSLQGDSIWSWANDVVYTFSAPLVNMGIVDSGPNGLYFPGTIVNLPNLAYAKKLTFTSSTMTQLTLPSLISAELTIQGCTLLTSVSLPSLTTFLSTNVGFNPAGPIIKNNPHLSTLSIPALSVIDNSSIAYPTVTLTYNGFSSAGINELLHKFLTVGPVYGIDLRYQQPPAPPTGQGIIDKQTLGSQGKNTLTD
jgi:hypothetical protein